MSGARSVAIIGAGIGAQHLSGYLALPDQFRVSAICDLDRERAGPLCERAGARYIADINDVLADEEIDIVDICLPPHLHFDAATAALKADKDVIVEKPMVASLRDADALAEVTRATGKSVYPVFQYRFGPAASQLRALQAAGLTGKAYVAALETHWNRGVDYYATPWRGTWAGEQGGAVLGHAIHIHDWVCGVLGPVASVHAELATRVNEIETEDCGALALRMENGALVTSSITLGAAQDTSRMRFVFERLTAESGRLPYAPAEDEWQFTARDPGDQAEIDSVVATADATHSGFAGLFAEVAKALDGEDHHAVTLEDGRRSVEFVTAVYDSARRGVRVSLPLGADHALYGGWQP